MFYQYDVPIPERQTRLDTPPQPEYSCDATWPSQKRKSKRWHNAVNLFERLAAATWVRIGCAEHLRTRFGEVAITETNLLDIKVEGNLLAQVRLSNQKEEAKLGFDFELWIGSSRARSWWRYCVQAKKLGQRQLKYENLGYKVKTSGGKSLLQIDLLDRYASKVYGIPLYCFYNYFPFPLSKENWHCKGPTTTEQVGCTVVPLNTVRGVLGNRKRGFQQLHVDCPALPWRCLVRCPRMAPNERRPHPLAIGRDNPRPRVYRAAPPLGQVAGAQYVGARDFPELVINEESLTTDPQFRDFYPANLAALPRWIGIVEIG